MVAITNIGGPYMFSQMPSKDQITKICPLWKWADVYQKDGSFICTVHR